ncbi:MAG: trimethylamine methyltransferase family protein [candidate division KSB1 bacterium]|nr:trimethylamine methyltransferase family protein [candidate division KSB1 bacterium]
MLRPTVKLLTQELIEKIVAEALEILEKVGVLVEHEEASGLLGDAGARLEQAQKKAYIPKGLVERCLKTVPRTITLFDRTGHLAMKLEGDEIHFDPGSAALTILDWKSQRQRKPTTDDVIQFARLTAALDHLDAQSTGLIASDVPEEIADRYRLYLALLNCPKPVVTGTFAIEGFEIMKEMLVVVRGTEAELRQKPLAIFDCCPSPPLKWSHLTCQNLMDCARAGIPSELVSMPLTGATAPATLTGALVQHTAENLSGIVISQLTAPGAPVIYGGSPSAFDMHQGTTPMGAIETMMIDAAYAQIGKYLGLPTHAYMGLSDAKVLDAQAGLETAMGALLAALSGINVISGPGMLDFESCQSLEKLVIDNEICGMAKRLVQGIQVRSENLAEDLWGNIYEGEHFLTSPSTLKWFREEFYFPSRAIDRDHYEAWCQEGGLTAGERAHQLVEKILKEKVPPPLGETEVRELNKSMATNARKYGIDKLPGGY